MKTRSQPVPVAGDRFVPWVSRLPSDWRVRPLKYVCRINAKTLGDETDPAKEITYIDIGSVDSDGVVSSGAEMTFTQAPSRARRILTAGDVFLSTVRTYLTAIGYCVTDLEGHICSTGFAVLTPGPEVDSRFLYYWVRASHFVGEVVARSTGVSYPAINASEVGNLPFPSIPLQEQRAIAATLDRRVGQLDAVVAKKQRMIDLLHEKRLAVISEAVTKGLNHDVPTKGSGIEWLGPVPKHWNMIRLKLVAQVQTGITLGKSYSAPTQAYPYLRVANVQDGSFNLDEITEISVPATDATRCLLRVGDVLMTEGGDLDKLGRGSVWVGQISDCLHQNHIFAVRPDQRRVLPEFLAHLTRAKHGREYFTMTGQKTTNLASTNSTKVGDFPLPLPPLPEQRSICDFIAAASARLDDLIAKNQKHIQLLVEYRQTLISAAVTGQIDVAASLVQPVQEKPAAKSNPYFRRTVLAAEIIDQMCAQPTFGHVKFQKCLFVAQHHLRLPDFEENYQRAAAGPYDNRMIRSIDSQLEKQRWFRAEQMGERYSYKRMDRAGNHRKYFDSYFGDKADELKKLLELFKPLDTDRAEIVATLYAVWNDFLIRQEACDDDRTVSEVLTNWHDRKKRFDEDRWRKALGWMKNKALVPTGFGKPTMGTEEK